MPKTAKTCPHENAICLGVDGTAYFRCIECGEVLIMEKGKSWRLEPLEAAA